MYLARDLGKKSRKEIGPRRSENLIHVFGKRSWNAPKVPFEITAFKKVNIRYNRCIFMARRASWSRNMCFVTSFILRHHPYVVTGQHFGKVSLSTNQPAIITTYAGNGVGGFSGDGGAAASAQLYSPSGVAVDVSGNVFISDYSNHRIRLVTKSTGLITTYAGNGGS